RLGAVVDISAKPGAAGPRVVELAPCGSAEARFVDAQGKPLQQKFWLELLVRPGPAVPKDRAEAMPLPEAALLASPYPAGEGGPPLAVDAQGRVAIPALIPGATYRIKVLAGPAFEENEVVLEKDFTVESGKTTRLELVVPTAR